MLRIERTLTTLQGAMQAPIAQQDRIWVLKGDYKNFESAYKDNLSNPSHQDLPWRLNDQDARYFFGWEMTLPVFEQNVEYSVRISTGREGQWDAVNPQLLAYVEGRVICGLDTNHRNIVLDPALSATTCQFGCHLYTGMAPGDLAIRIELIATYNAIHRAYWDLKVLNDAIKAIDEINPIKNELYQRVRHQVDPINFGTSREEMEVGAQLLSAALNEHCYGHDHELPYTVHAIGHTHIDVAWLWDLRQTAEKVARSYATALNLQERYKDYTFMASQPIFYDMLEANQPEIYKRVMEAQDKGLWESEGAMYLEADCNLSGGESLIRQIERGASFYKSRCLWLPDVFGYSAALPQILKEFGIELFVTSKISWNDTNRLPFDSFTWQGIDGSSIATQFITTTSMETLRKGDHRTIYEGNLTPTEVLGCALRNQQRTIQPHAIMPYGYGDGGGGATSDMLETAQRLQKGVAGMPKFCMSSLGNFIDAYLTTPTPVLPVWQGELYLEYHRGTYTTNGGIKKRYRQLEDRLVRAELLITQDYLNQRLDLEGSLMLQDSLRKHWDTLLLNGFHDILPGTSIERVYTEAYAQLDEALNALGKIVDTGRNTGDQLIALNVLDMPLIGLVPIVSSVDIQQLHQTWPQLPIVRLGESALLAVDNLQPFIGKYMTETKVSSSTDDIDEPIVIKANEELHTPNYSFCFDAWGNLKGLYDKIANRHVFKPQGQGLSLEAYEDRPMRWDAWDIDSDYVKHKLDFSTPAQMTVLHNTDNLLSIEVRRMINRSQIIQYFAFSKILGHKRIDVFNEVQWHEHQVLLRAEADLNLNAPFATYDIQFGYVHRPMVRNTPYDAAQFEVCAQHWGNLSQGDYNVTLMSNDKFGYSAYQNKLGMSLIKSPTWPNANSDQGKHVFSYAILPQQGCADYVACHRQAMAFTKGVWLQLQNSKDLAFDKVGHPLKPLLFQQILEQVPSNLTLEAARVLDDGHVMIRLCERANAQGSFNIKAHNHIGSIQRISLAGHFVAQYPCIDDQWQVSYKPFEIMTLKLKIAH